MAITGVALFAAVSVAASLGAAATKPYAGEWKARMTEAQLIDQGFVDPRAVGVWRLVLEQDGTYRAFNPLDKWTNGDYTATDRRIDLQAGPGLPRVRLQGAGRYRWSVKNGKLKLTTVSIGSDPCGGRFQTLSVPALAAGLVEKNDRLSLAGRLRSAGEAPPQRARREGGVGARAGARGSRARARRRSRRRPTRWSTSRRRTPSSANVEAAVAAGVPCVVGTSGADLAGVGERAAAAGVPVFFAPNFALGAVLMMRFAAEAAKHLPRAEIVEAHNEAKVDAPSGTAKATAEAMGGDVAIHSVRLPGLVAHQEVLLAGEGQLLTIRHDAFSREAYVPGVLLALERVRDLPPGLTVGLDALL